MKPLLTDENVQVLKTLDFSTTLFAFDFDGTLAPICENFADAKMSKRTEQLLADINMKTTMSIISGRSLHDLESRIYIQTKYLIGNHGIEGLWPSENLLKIKKTHQELKIFLASYLNDECLDSEIEVEDKGYSLTIHYKKAKDRHNIESLLAKKLAHIEYMARIIPGKNIFNIIPLEAPNKGQALMELLQHTNAKAAFFIGDDDTDEDVFSINDSRLLTVRVGKKIGSKAHYFIERQEDIDTLLQYLIQCH